MLAENGYGETANDGGDKVLVRQKDSGPDLASTGGAYGPDDLPNLGAAGSVRCVARSAFCRRTEAGCSRVG